jgi:hypothetical protein
MDCHSLLSGIIAVVVLFERRILYIASTLAIQFVSIVSKLDLSEQMK